MLRSSKLQSDVKALQGSQYRGSSDGLMDGFKFLGSIVGPLFMISRVPHRGIHLLEMKNRILIPGTRFFGIFQNLFK